MDTAIVTALIGVTGGLVGVWIGGTRGSTSIIGGWPCLLKTCATAFTGFGPIKTSATSVLRQRLSVLSGTDPLLYTASRAIGPRQLTEEEARSTSRRA